MCVAQTEVRERAETMRRKVEGPVECERLVCRTRRARGMWMRSRLHTMLTPMGELFSLSRESYEVGLEMDA